MNQANLLSPRTARHLRKKILQFNLSNAYQNSMPQLWRQWLQLRMTHTTLRTMSAKQNHWQRKQISAHQDRSFLKSVQSNKRSSNQLSSRNRISARYVAYRSKGRLSLADTNRRHTLAKAANTKEKWQFTLREKKIGRWDWEPRSGSSQKLAETWTFTSSVPISLALRSRCWKVRNRPCQELSTI